MSDKIETVKVSLKELECLREHLNQALKLLDAISGSAGKQTISGKLSKETKQQKIERYSNLISSEKSIKPASLKKK